MNYFRFINYIDLLYVTEHWNETRITQICLDQFLIFEINLMKKIKQISV